MTHTLNDYNVKFDRVHILYDNTPTIKIAQNLVHHSRTKHIEVGHHFIRDCVQNGLVYVEFCTSK